MQSSKNKLKTSGAGDGRGGETACPRGAPTREEGESLPFFAGGHRVGSRSCRRRRVRPGVLAMWPGRLPVVAARAAVRVWGEVVPLVRGGAVVVALGWPVPSSHWCHYKFYESW